jgi:hypothetical protein
VGRGEGGCRMGTPVRPGAAARGLGLGRRRVTYMKCVFWYQDGVIYDGLRSCIRLIKTHHTTTHGQIDFHRWTGYYSLE